MTKIQIRIFLIVAWLGGALYFFRGCLFPQHTPLNRTHLPDAVAKKKAAGEYERLKCIFKPEVLNHLLMTSSVSAMAKHSILWMAYDRSFNYGSRFTLITYAMNAKRKNVDISRFVQISPKDEVNRSEGVSNSMDSGDIEFYYRYEHDSLAQQILLDYDGVIEKKTVLGDSVICLGLNVTDFMIRYEPDGIYDFGLHSTNGSWGKKGRSFVNLAFVRKSDMVYILMQQGGILRPTPGLVDLLK